jgi:hypothetical protein
MHNQIVVMLKYENGNELMPVIKRTITRSAGVRIENYLTADEKFFRPYMDRKSGFATFTYNDDLLELLSKYPNITGIRYEIDIENETLGSSGDYPVYPDIMRALSIKTDPGITTAPSAIGSGDVVYYVPSQKDLIFTAYCDEAIEVSTDRGTDDRGGVEVVKDKDSENAYTVTIRRVASDFTVSIKKTTQTESNSGGGGTANTTLTGDAVWASGGTLHVTAAKAGVLSIYNITGQLYKVASVTGSYTLSMPKGVYIVQLNGKAYKVIL